MAEGNLEVILDTRELDKFADQLSKININLPDELDQAVSKTANEGKRPITEKTPKITGNLRRAFQVKKIRSMLWRIYNLMPYLMFIEEGVRNDPRSGLVHRKKGPAKMMENSLKEIQELLDKNVTVRIKSLLDRIN